MGELGHLENNNYLFSPLFCKISTENETVLEYKMLIHHLSLIFLAKIKTRFCQKVIVSTVFCWED